MKRESIKISPCVKIVVIVMSDPMLRLNFPPGGAEPLQGDMLWLRQSRAGFRFGGLHRSDSDRSYYRRLTIKTICMAIRCEIHGLFILKWR